MNFSKFFDNFELVTTAPGAVARLREMILDLAVRGRLAAQNDGDEPARVLLDRIKAEKQRLSNGKAKLFDDFAPLDEADAPFAIPKNWVWTRLENVAEMCLGKMLDKQKNKGEFMPYLRNVNVRWFDFNLSDVLEMKFEERELERFEVKEGDVLVCEGGEPGRAAIWDARVPQMKFQKAIHRVRPSQALYNKFLVYYLFLNAKNGKLSKHFTGATIKHLTGQELARVEIPLPPFEEQKRIVAKVDELMRLCDLLDAQLKERDEARGRLRAAALGRLTVGGRQLTTANEGAASAVRLVAENFELLANTPDAPRALRQVVLQLAVQGKLVAQSDADEPAAQLLARIKAEKQRLSNGKTKLFDDSTDIADDETPFEIPKSWVWTRFAEMTINRDGERIPLEKSVRAKRQGEYDYYGASGIIDKIDDFLFDKPLLLIGEDGANLINRSTPIAFIAKGKYWVNNHAHVLDSISFDVLRYLEVFINAIDLRPYITGTAQPKMNQAKMNSILVPVPPLEEQKRIVGKVEQIFGLCERLEVELKRQSEDGQTLLRSLIADVLGDA